MAAPFFNKVAELAQLVERRLPKPKVASSNLVFRSRTNDSFRRSFVVEGRGFARATLVPPRGSLV